MSRITKRECHRRKPLQIIIWFVAGMALWHMALFPVQANDAGDQLDGAESGIITENSRIVTAVGEVDARETPDASAPVVISYHDGDHIYVIGETSDGWYQVKYQELTGFVPAEQAKEMELDVAALDDEFALEAEEGKLVVEEVERQRTELRRSKVWGAVIVLLVLGVFVTGIISTVKNGGKESEWE